MDDLILVFSQRQDVFLVFVAIFSLMVGSFLNVVIHRLPVMMRRQWQYQCQDLGLSELQDVEDVSRFDLILPGSHCPHCHAPVRAWQNIPLISYLLLKGKCAQCKTPISLRYPLLELGTMLLSLFVANHFGFTWACLGALLLLWALICLTMIDFDSQLLPDAITLPFLWLGLLFNLQQQFTDIESAIYGAVFGYLGLWSIYHAFRLLTGKEGMGYGDFKLAAMIGAWLGWQMLPLVYFASSLVGAILGLSLIALGKSSRDVPMPFGPYLAIAGLLALLWGESIMNHYFNWVV